MRKPLIMIMAIGLCMGMLGSSAYAAEYQPERIPLLKSNYVTGNLEQDMQQARNLITWQMDHGGWWKYADDRYLQPWDGEQPRSDKTLSDGTEIGIIDNDATVDEILFLALMYRESGAQDLKEAALKGLDFVLTMQYETGGWPQVYPLNGTYADNVTFNDGAMLRVMNMLKLVVERQYPFDSNLVDETKLQQVQQALDAGLDYILKSQIIVNDLPTAWSQQHDPFTYEASQGRAFEHPSISGSESVGIVDYLLAIPDPSEEVKKAIVAALRWFDQVKLDGYKYIKGDPQAAYFYYDGESITWYRLYEIGTNHPIFSDHSGVIKHNVHQLRDRGGGYSWAGDWAKDLLPYMETLDYFKEISYQLDVDRFEKQKQRQAETAIEDLPVDEIEGAEPSVNGEEYQPTAQAVSSHEVEQSKLNLPILLAVAILALVAAFEVGRRFGMKKRGE